MRPRTRESSALYHDVAKCMPAGDKRSQALPPPLPPPPPLAHLTSSRFSLPLLFQLASTHPLSSSSSSFFYSLHYNLEPPYLSYYVCIYHNTLFFFLNLYVRDLSLYKVHSLFLYSRSFMQTKWSSFRACNHNVLPQRISVNQVICYFTSFFFIISLGSLALSST